MAKIILDVLVAIFLIGCHAGKISVIYLNVTGPPQKKYGKLEVTQWEGSDQAVYFNSTATIFEDLGRQKEFVQLYQQSSLSDTACTHLYFQSSFDFCRSISDASRNPFMRTFLDGFLKGADHIPGCVTLKGVYKATNFTFNEMLFMPIKNRLRFRLVFKFMAMKKDNRTLIHLYTVNLLGFYGRNLSKQPPPKEKVAKN